MDYGLLIVQVLLALALIGMILGVIAYLILLERKSSAWMQDRIGPNRVGPFGLLQPLADGAKFLLKEEFIPTAADRGLFLLAPVAIMTPALCGFAVIPWAGVLQAGSSIPKLFTFAQNWPVMVANPDVGVLWVLAMAGLSTYGVVIAGYASGSKYSFFGGLRATAQMLSYEVPMALALMAVVVLMGSLNLGELTAQQAHYAFGVIPHWNAFMHPVAFVIFVTCIFAESNRLPFDLAECEQELVGGYHTEYSSMKFALFFLAEYAAMVTGSCVAVSVFLGGWHLPWLDLAIYGGPQPLVSGWGGVALKFGVFWGKVIFFLFFYMWVRWTLPRFRFDQLMNLAWRALVPLSLAAFVIAAFFVYLREQIGLAHVGVWIALANIALVAATMVVVSVQGKPAILNKRVRVPGSRYNPGLAAAGE
ncbi:MAG: NADH-quinone oxidoreductase subunit NuoH [Phycisphaerae bacterium]